MEKKSKDNNVIQVYLKKASGVPLYDGMAGCSDILEFKKFELSIDAASANRHLNRGAACRHTTGCRSAAASGLYILSHRR